jgi:hypothetical protein
MKRLSEILKWFGMETNVGKINLMRISRQSLPAYIIIDQKQPETVEYFII